MFNRATNLLNGGEVYAHCDLMCGVYDPAQARIEAQSVYNAVKIYQDTDDEITKQRALQIKEERAEMVKHHLWVLWTDYFKKNHAEKFDNLHDLFWRATKAAGAVKKTAKLEDVEKLINLVDEVGKIFEQTKDGYEYKRVLKNITIQAK